MAFLGQEEQVREFQDRFRYLYAILFIGLGLLSSRLVYLQVLRGEQMRHYSEENRIKRVKVAAPRGMIFDRNHKLLIDNRPAFDLEVIPQYLNGYKEKQNVIQMLSKLIHMTPGEIQDVLNRNRDQPTFMPVKIKIDLTRDEVAAVESWKISMPGVEVREEIKRTNVYGELASHLLGYIGEVSPTELPQLNKPTAKYKVGDVVGKFGLEQKLEDIVRGIDGEEIKEVDALGRVKLDKDKGRVLAENTGKAAVPGKNLVLTIDQDLQLAAAKAFGDKIGSMVAINPKNGEILAMMSRPSFDPTEFSRGIPTALWNKLLNNENHPLRDKTIQDHYPPGSTFKLLTAIAGLEEGVINEHTTFNCPGSLRVGNRVYHCHKRGGHGSVNVIGALTQSCDVFFYHVALKLKSIDDLSKWAFALGLGKKTGIALSREVPGLIPTEEWKMKHFNQPWNGGDTVNVAIGQGFVLATVIQLANYYAAVGNGGTVYRPFIVKQIESSDGRVLKEFDPEILSKAPLHQKTVDIVKEGLWGVINTVHGTAAAAKFPVGMNAAGKTGSAQVIRFAADKIMGLKCESLKFLDRHHALFVAFAPVKNPTIAIAIVGEHACHGAYIAPVAREVIKTYLEKYYPDIYGEKVLATAAKDNKSPATFPRGSESDEDVVIPDDGNQGAAPPLPPLPPLPPPKSTTNETTEIREGDE